MTIRTPAKTATGGDGVPLIPGPTRSKGRASLRVPHLTPAERAASGRAARQLVPRSSHAELPLPADRPDPVALLERQAATRVPQLVPVRNGRMASSAFAFYRGAAAVMASDLSRTRTSGITVQACGDAHLSNFGLYASAERRLVFDLNDFDETLPGPWEWDVKRLVASLMIAARSNGFTAADARSAVLAAVAEYRQAMARFAAMGNLEVWYASTDVEGAMGQLRALADRTRIRRTEKMIDKAKTRDHLKAFSKLVEMVDGQPRFISDPPLLVPIGEFATPDQASAVTESVRRSLREYRASLTTDRRHLLESFSYVDMAHKVVGVGSVGTRAWVVLLVGRDTMDPLLLQVKEAQASVLEEYVGRSEYTNCGHRVVSGQRLMQTSSDIFLGWQHVEEGLDGGARDFYVRQLHDWKGSVEVEQMVPKGMALYARLCGWTLARAHARTGDRIAIAAYLGVGTAFDMAVCEFAEAYADQNDKDYAALLAAIDSGRVQAVSGV